MNISLVTRLRLFSNNNSHLREKRNYWGVQGGCLRLYAPHKTTCAHNVISVFVLFSRLWDCAVRPPLHVPPLCCCHRACCVCELLPLPLNNSQGWWIREESNAARKKVLGGKKQEFDRVNNLSEESPISHFQWRLWIRLQLLRGSVIIINHYFCIDINADGLLVAPVTFRAGSGASAHLLWPIRYPP